MQISKKSQYGMRAMVLLAKNYKSKQLLNLKEISQKEIIPFEFLGKIVSQLEKAKLVKGKSGVGGGYILAKDPKKITAKDIVEVLEDTMPVNCSFCGRKGKCASKSVWGKVDLAIAKALKSVKLSSLIK
jgi:Rrf2 family protein